MAILRPVCPGLRQAVFTHKTSIPAPPDGGDKFDVVQVAPSCVVCFPAKRISPRKRFPILVFVQTFAGYRFPKSKVCLSERNACLFIEAV